MAVSFTRGSFLYTQTYDRHTGGRQRMKEAPYWDRSEVGSRMGSNYTYYASWNFTMYVAGDVKVGILSIELFCFEPFQSTRKSPLVVSIATKRFFCVI